MSCSEQNHGIDLYKLVKDDVLKQEFELSNGLAQAVLDTIQAIRDSLISPTEDPAAAAKMTRGQADCVLHQQRYMPLKIPSFTAEAQLVFFMASLLEDEWIMQNGLIIVFDSVDGGRIFGIGRKSDLPYWDSNIGCRHLNSDKPNFYEVGEYAIAVLQNFTKGNS